MKHPRHLPGPAARRGALALALLGASAPLLPACAASSYYHGRSRAMRVAQSPSPPVAPGDAVAEPSGEASQEAPPASQPAPSTGSPPRAARLGLATNTTPDAPQTNTPSAQGGTESQSAPMLIYTADLTMRVERERFEAVLDAVLAGARSRGGYLVRRDDASIQVRVPSARFHESVGAVEELGEITRRNVAAEDVSEEFRDAEVRLQNLRAVRQRLEEFLRRAGTMAEALQVERELERVTQEIDRLQGRLRFLAARVAFSLVNVGLQERPTVIAAPRTVEVTPPRRTLSLPVRWLRELGLERLLGFESEG